MLFVAIFLFVAVLLLCCSLLSSFALFVVFSVAVRVRVRCFACACVFRVCAVRRCSRVHCALCRDLQSHGDVRLAFCWRTARGKGALSWQF